MTPLSLLITGIRIILGFILLFSGVAKLTDFSVFLIDVNAYQMLPIVLVKPVSYLLVSAEITVGMALCIGYFSRGAAMLSGFLFLIFAVALANVLWRDLPIADCGCSNFLFSLLDVLGLSVSGTPNWKIVFADVVFSVVSMGVVFSSQQGYGLESLIQKVKRHEV